MKERLLELVAKWQKLSYNKVVANGSALVYRDCATELEEVLRHEQFMSSVCMNAHKYVHGIMQPCAECGG